MSRIKGYVNVASANVVSIVVSVAGSLLLPFWLSIEGYSEYRYFTLLVSYIGFLHLGYVDGVLLKYISRGNDTKEFKNDFIIFLIFQVAITALVLIPSMLYNDPVVVYFALAILPINCFNLVQFYYQATGQLNLFSKSVYISSILLIIPYGIAGLFHNLLPNNFFIISFIIAYLATLLILSGKILYNTERVKLVFSGFGELIKNGSILMIANFMLILLFSADRWFIKSRLDDGAFAFYSFSISIIMLIVSSFRSLSNILLPFLATNNSSGKVQSIVSILLFVIPISLPFIHIVSILVNLFLPEYSQSVDILEIMLPITIPYIVIISVHVNLFKVFKLQKKYLLICAALLLISLFLNYTIGIYYKSIISNAIILLFVWVVLFGINNLILKIELTLGVYIYTLCSLMFYYAFCIIPFELSSGILFILHFTLQMVLIVLNKKILSIEYAKLKSSPS